MTTYVVPSIMFLYLNEIMETCREATLNEKNKKSATEGEISI